MNRTFFVIASLATFSFVTGCGDASSSDRIDAPDFAAAEARFDGSPTGSLTKENGATVASSTRKSSTQGREGMNAQPLGGGSSSGTGTRSLRLLSTGLRPLADSSEKVCADIEANEEVGSCACDSGSLRYEIPNIKALKEAKSLPDNAEMKIKFEGCKIESKTFDGLFAMKIEKPSSSPATNEAEEADEDEESPLEPASPQVNDFLVVMNMTVDAEKIALAFAYKEGAFWYSVDVDQDGKYVLVKLGSYADGNGTYSVMAKNGQYDCKLAGGKGDCKKKGGTEKISVDEDG